MSPPAGSDSRESGTARILGSGTSGIAELLVFHPVDTIAKRLMSNKAKLSASTLNATIFRQAADFGLGGKFLSLFPGLGYAAGYKVAQRVYKFGGQPYFRDVIDKSPAKAYFESAFGAKTGKMMIHATAGSLTGIGEVVLLPLDVLKIKMQTNPDALRGRGLVKLVTDEGIASLYRGWGWTMARNAPGSFAVRETLGALRHSSLLIVPPVSLRVAVRRIGRRQGVHFQVAGLFKGDMGTKWVPCRLSPCEASLSLTHPLVLD